MESGRCLTPRAELRASFQAFHELVLLQKLVDEVKTSWGLPRDWTAAQYQELVRSISLAQEKIGSSEISDSPVLAQAFALRYQFEEIAENQRKLSREDDAAASYLGTTASSPTSSSSPASTSPVGVRRQVTVDTAAPPIHSYFSTFEKLLSPPGVHDGDDQDIGSPLTPRHATMAKYARLYLESDERAKQPWSLERVSGDDVRDRALRESWSDADVVDVIADRFENDRVYTWLSDRSMAFVNPYRMLQTPKFTSIYDEEVVMTYAGNENAERALAPHPFAVAKMAATRAFFDTVVKGGQAGVGAAVTPNDSPLSILLCGESGSGKTELAKELLKYLVLMAEPVLSLGGTSSEGGKNAAKNMAGKRDPAGCRPRVRLFTSSTKSTVQMRTEEARTIALLEAKGVDDFEIVLLDLNPQRWPEMTAVSQSKRLPQLHVDGLFFGFYDSLERLADAEQLRMYLKNPRAAKKLSMVLDSNVILEAFGHAATAMNANSSRFGKTTAVELALGRHPDQFQIRGCRISPFLLEKSRVTVVRGGSGQYSAQDDGVPARDGNFHVFYAMVAGVNAIPSQRATLANELRLGGASCDAFAYLGKRSSANAAAQHAGGARGNQDAWKRDVDKWVRVLDALTAMELAADEQKAIFKMLSAMLWLGNIKFDAKADSGSNHVRMASIERSGGQADPQVHVASLLGLSSVSHLEKMLTTRRVRMATTGEAFEVKLEKGQVGHVRDALARLLYQAVFQHVVERMNAMTQPEDEEVGGTLSHVEIVDVFGFEELRHNSLDQLCINYLSEKLFFRQDEALTAICRRYGGIGDPSASKVISDPDSSVLSLYEHPGSGIFACLEELTVLHQGENETPEQERKKNQLFVRTLQERSPALRVDLALPVNGRKDAPHVRSLLFVVPHARGDVVYDADEFVKKNSDFVYTSMLEELAASVSSQVASVLTSTLAAGAPINRGGAVVNGSKLTTSTSPSTSSSLVRQFRLQVNALTRYEHPEGVKNAADAAAGSRPFYFHCLRPNSDVRPSVADATLVLRQVRAQRLARQINLSGSLTSYYSVSCPVEALLKRYGCLFARPSGMSSDEAARLLAVDDESHLALKLHGLLHGECRQDGCDYARVRDDMVFLRSVADVEALEKHLSSREEEAATRIQALLRMHHCWTTFMASRERRRSLADELLEFYGRDQRTKVDKVLRKYRGREDELGERLRAKRLAKAQEHQVALAMEKELHALCLNTSGGLSAQVVNEILGDETLRGFLQRNDAIVAALRDMSLNPESLSAQLADPALREFYEKLLVFLRERAKRMEEEAREDPDEKSEEPIDEQVGGMSTSLDERVHSAVALHHSKWMALARRAEWAKHRSALEEIGEDPDLLVFHVETAAFARALASFLDALDVDTSSDDALSVIDSTGELSSSSERTEEGDSDAFAAPQAAGADAELMELLLTVQFDSALLDAMRGDVYFAQAMQNPILATSLQQVRRCFMLSSHAATEYVNVPCFCAR